MWKIWFAVHFEKTAIMTFRKHGRIAVSACPDWAKRSTVFPQVESVTFSLPDILSDLAVPRLESLAVEVSA